MNGITIRVLDGADRGRVFQNLAPPITIGREEGNTIQLNDERVSRYHVKIQEDHQRLARLREGDGEGSRTADPEELEKAANISSLDFELNWSEDADLQATIHALEPPELPERMTPGQAAQLAELLEFLHLRLRNLIAAVQVDSKVTDVKLDLRQWQALIDLQARLSEYLRQVGEP